MLIRVRPRHKTCYYYMNTKYQYFFFIRTSTYIRYHPYLGTYQVLDLPVNREIENKYLVLLIVMSWEVSCPPIVARSESAVGGLVRHAFCPAHQHIHSRALNYSRYDHECMLLIETDMMLRLVRVH